MLNNRSSHMNPSRKAMISTVSQPLSEQLVNYYISCLLLFVRGRVLNSGGAPTTMYYAIHTVRGDSELPATRTALSGKQGWDRVLLRDHLKIPITALPRTAKPSKHILIRE
jgi:hypothetical protein